MKRILSILVILLGSAGCATPATTMPVTTEPTSTPTSSPTPAPTQTATQPVQPGTSSPGSALVLGYRNSHYELKRIDLATGQAVSTVSPFVMGGYVMDGLSPDGSQLALFNYPDGNSPLGGSLELVDTGTLRSLKTINIDFQAFVNLVVYSPDGQSLAISYGIGEGVLITGWRIALVDLKQGVVTAQADLDFSPNLVRFSPDGKTIVAYGVHYASGPAQPPGIPQVALFGAADLHPLWKAAIDGLMDGFYPWEGTPPPGDSYAGIQWTPASAFSTDGSKLYLAHADVDRLTTVDFARKSITTVDVSPQKSFLDRLMGFGAGVAQAKAFRGAMLSGVLSADGAHLFVTGMKMDFSVDSSNQIQSVSTPLGVREIDVASGAVLSSLDSQASAIARSAEGERLFLTSYDKQGMPSTQVVDANTLKIIATVPDFQVYPSPIRLADGRQALPAIRWADNSSVLGLVDADTFKLISSWDDPDGSDWVTESR